MSDTIDTYVCEWCGTTFRRRTSAVKTEYPTCSQSCATRLREGHCSLRDYRQRNAESPPADLIDAATRGIVYAHSLGRSPQGDKHPATTALERAIAYVKPSAIQAIKTQARLVPDASYWRPPPPSPPPFHHSPAFIHLTRQVAYAIRTGQTNTPYFAELLKAREEAFLNPHLTEDEARNLAILRAEP